MGDVYGEDQVVTQTPGGSPGDGSLSGALTVQAKYADPDALYLIKAGTGGSGIKTYASNDGFSFVRDDGTDLFAPRSGFTDFPNGGLLRVQSGGISYYDNMATAGIGAVIPYADTKQKSETGADTALLSYTPPASAGSYVVYFSADVSAAATATGFGWTITYTDSNGHAQAPTNVQMSTLGVAGHNLTVTAAANGHYSGHVEIDIDNSATAIVVKTTFTGTSIAYKASAWIEQVA